MSKVRGLALYEFKPSADVELALKPGDIVVVNKKNAGNGWCEGELNGKRGLFPKTFVRLITFGKEEDDDDEDEEAETTDNSPAHVPSPSTGTPTNLNPSPILSTAFNQSTLSSTPLTPMSSKKMFMETLLTPTPDTIKKVYDPEKAKEIFIERGEDEKVSIGGGPTWSNRPPSLTIAIHDTSKSVRSSGVKMQKTYDVITKELKVSVIRKYKHFLWLYDQLAEKMPCISLPPLPIKQSQLLTSGPGFMEAQRRCLERFLNRVARHPVLGCTKIFHLFLTATDEKEWRIGTGKHTSLIRSSGTKTSRKLLSASVYHSIQYPPYNVPLHQLASFDKFSKFTSIVEVNLSNMRKACETLKSMHGQMGSCLRSFGKDIQNLAEGADQPSLGARYRKPSQGVVSLPNTHNTTLLPLAATTSADEESENDEDTKQDVGGWNWREDETFKIVLTQLHDLGSCIRQTSLRAKRHQEQMVKGVIEGLEEYTGIVHTLPVLVKLHEDAMAMYNESKQKGSKMEAEDVRQDCETLNNILLAEFDYFSQQITEDIQKLILSLMKEEAEYHKKMASDWENMYSSFSENKPIRRTTIKRSTTLPGSQAADEGSPPTTQPPRPCSSDRKFTKTDVSPLSMRRHYVNLPSTLPAATKCPDDGSDDEHLYENLPKLKNSATYENWTPKTMSPKATPTVSNSTQPESLPPLNKPIPPPLIIKRHELSDTAEAERLGNKTDSFIVPNLAHYSQVSVGGSFEQQGEHKESRIAEEEEDCVNQSTEIEGMGSSLLDEVQERLSALQVTLEDSDPNNDSSERDRVDTLTAESVQKGVVQVVDHNDDRVGAYKVEKGEDLLTKVSSSKKDEDKTTPQTMSKLAQLTQLPRSQQQQSNKGSEGRPTSSDKLQKSSKSFSNYSTSTSGAKGRPLRTLPKLSSVDYGQSELTKKLEKQRRRLDKQLSYDEKLSPKRNGSNSYSPTEESSLKNDLSKFGIVEDESGGSFIV